MPKNYYPPFPWFGGKSKVAHIIWRLFGDVKAYIEPFFGSGAVLFLRPLKHKKEVEIVNDKDALIANFWRAVKNNPEEVTYYADNPINEADLTARHIWLVKYGIPDLKSKLFANPDYYDAKIAGWWVWGLCIWIGDGWCSGKGKWTEHGGKIVSRYDLEQDAGANMQKPVLTHNQGYMTHSETFVSNEIPFLGRSRRYTAHSNKFVSNKRFHLGHNMGYITHSKTFEGIYNYFQMISERLRDVKVVCGDWSRIVTKGALCQYGQNTGVFLDPPYSRDLRNKNLYNEDNFNLSKEVNQWCIENQNKYKIALCGYEGEHNNLEELGWRKYAWKANVSYQNSKNKGQNNKNRFMERIWYNRLCNPLSIFDGGIF